MKKSVHRFVALKRPEAVDNSKGTSFVYFDSTKSGWVESEKRITSDASAIGATVSQLYSKDKGVSEELGILSDVHELLDFGTEILECGLWIVLHFAKSTSADVGVFWIGEATDPYEALHLLGRDVVEFGHLVTSIDKSGVVAHSLVVALCPKGDVECLLWQDVVGEASVRGGVQLRDDEASFRGVVDSRAVICDDVLVAVVPYVERAAVVRILCELRKARRERIGDEFGSRGRSRSWSGSHDREAFHSFHHGVECPLLLHGLCVNAFCCCMMKKFYFTYNDECPGKSTDSYRGHSKGVIMFDQKQGFWMLHSVPEFPPLEKYSYPEAGTRFAQSFLCVTLDSNALHDLAKHLHVAHVNPCLQNLPNTIKLIAPELEDVVNKKKLGNKETTVMSEMKTLGKQKIKSFAKHKKYAREALCDLGAIRF
ncbi:deoxyribonuclease II [Ancylostoma ceylanicum]|uniref:Deoxyribonuclease II n=1 Tax=Ancylostoma ceylanicum TaxID=53326 RepID=A0A0D6L9S7_9BILA|nr:deoxyribonuclease II [Ancylostoma ceylanicum]